MRCGVPAVALSRVGARVVESGPGGQDLAAGTWQRLEALPDPRSPRGRIYPLACLIAVAVGAFTAAGNDRFAAVGQWIRRASQADLARLRAPWDPIAGRYRAPDEKTIRVVLERLDPRALTGALPGPGRRPGGLSSVSVRGYHARRAAQQAKALARDRLPAVAVDGKTSRGARRADGTRVHLLGVAEHGGRLLDHLEVGVKHNETSHFTALLASLDLNGAVVTFDALHTVRANLDWLVKDKKAHYIAVVKRNQPLLHARIKALPWRQVPAGGITRDTGHGGQEVGGGDQGARAEWLRAGSEVQDHQAHVRVPVPVRLPVGDRLGRAGNNQQGAKNPGRRKASKPGRDHSDWAISRWMGA